MDFKHKVISSFRNVKRDMESLQKSMGFVSREQDLLKRNTNEWIHYLVKENNALRDRITRLESRTEQGEVIRNFRY